ncbi:hypothetical protein MBLNU459_g5828t1 [Dothideomycetes sp. NU459]
MSNGVARTGNGTEPGTAAATAGHATASAPNTGAAYKAPRVYSEAARIREVYRGRGDAEADGHGYGDRYLEPAQINSRPHSLLQQQEHQQHRSEWTGPPLVGRQPLGSEDTALAAFAQLGALRLNAKRCIISIVSRDVEYVLAESTRTLSLQSDTVHDEHDALWLGTTSFPRCEGLADAAMTEWCSTRAETRPPPPEADFYYTDGISPHWMVLSDIRRHPEVQGRVLVKCGAGLRFLCSVPIRSPAGLVLGSYAILDDKPRYGISVGDMEFMEDIADTIMSHLEAKRASSQRERGDRLIKGLALFNDGKNSLREWWLANYSRHQRGEGQRRRRRSQSDDELRMERADEELGQTYRADELDSRGRFNAPGSPGAVRPAARLGSTAPAALAGASDSVEQPQDPSDGAAEAPVQPVSDAPSRQGPEFDIAKEVDAVFSRASNLIRESINAEGVMFIDADFTRTTQEKRGRYKKASKKKQQEEDESHRSSSETGSANASEFDIPDIPEDEPRSQSAASSHSLETNCALLGFSTKIRSSLRGFSASQKHSSLPKKLMEKLIRRYPLGRVFNYHEGKSLSSSSGASGTEFSDVPVHVVHHTNESNRRRSKESRYAEMLAKLISDPRSVAFIPLWDSRRERYRAGIFVWNTMPNRFLDAEEDVTYLAAFGNSVMAELTRLDALAADQAKATFISSVSHELRSPLHGVLAGVELLQESTLSTYQEEMATTISLAGKTLLDTINNILDFTKINSFTDVQRDERKNKDLSRNVEFKSADMGEIGVTSIVDLAELTENVVDTIVTARRYQTRTAKPSKKPSRRSSSKILPISRTAAPYNSSSDEDVAEEDPSHIGVSLEVAQRSTWRTNISPGSWTRTITNILGNALKYTKSGTVSVRLDFKDSIKTNQTGIELIIEDTGQGISEEYMRNHLYTPFMQENSHSVGTGLGLSIVKQIVEGLGGRLDMTSEVGRGTKVTISLVRQFEKPTTPSGEANYDTCVAVPSRLGRDVKLAFLATQGRSEQHRRERLLKTKVAKTCSDWLRCDCDVIKSDQAGSPIPDIFILTEEEYAMWMEMRGRSGQSKKLQPNQPEPPMIILSSFKDLGVGKKASLAGQSGIVFVSQPFGPRKMFRALSAALGFERSKKSEEPKKNLINGLANNHDGGNDDDDDDDTCREAESPGSRTQSRLAHRPEKMRRHSSRSSGGDVETPALEGLSPGFSALQGPFSNGQARSARRTILLVEDNSINMKATVRKLGRSYAQASNGKEAVERYCATPAMFALVLMDISMPVMDGFAATEGIRAAEQENGWKRCLIVALTGVASQEARDKAFACGVDTFMTKPASMQTLRTIVENLDIETD